MLRILYLSVMQRFAKTWVQAKCLAPVLSCSVRR
ncbi:hypothetical protein KLMIMMO078B3_29060 [Klebsiella michiganensis]